MKARWSATAASISPRSPARSTSARERSQALAAQQAPDFSLPDLDGRLHTLREHRGKKILLVAWASW
jgi:hypothetical protein